VARQQTKPSTQHYMFWWLQKACFSPPSPPNTHQVSEVATLFDDDGILVRFMNSNVEGNGIR